MVAVPRAIAAVASEHGAGGGRLELGATALAARAQDATVASATGRAAGSATGNELGFTGGSDTAQLAAEEWRARADEGPGNGWSTYLSTTAASMLRAGRPGRINEAITLRRNPPGQRRR